MKDADELNALCVPSQEVYNTNNTRLNYSNNFSRKYIRYTNYTPWPTPCEVAVEMATMVSCEHTAAASLGWAAFDWAEHCIKQERKIKENEVCETYVLRQSVIVRQGAE